MKYIIPLIQALFLASIVSCGNPATTVSIIPVPQSVEMSSGTFRFNSQTGLYTNLEGEARQFLTDYLDATLSRLNESAEPIEKNGINLLLVTAKDNFTTSESYRLEINPSTISISAGDEAGLFYGIQSLLQVIGPAKDESALTAPSIIINDAPRFPYRGMHLDVSRHFFDVAFVKKQLDAMARYKLNRFHWHLTDGAGWRIEIKAYPLLTERAAWRTHSNWKEWWNSDRLYSSKDDPDAYGGYYTQDEVKDIVAYAAKRYITVIPEIEMPGHSEEVLAVYPQLSCSGKPYVESDFCIGNEETFTFLENVLTEVMALFPSEYIHIGGDEAAKTGWKNCPKCAVLMKREGLKNVDELQSYMIHRIETFLNAHGRRLLGWDEILEGGLAPDATVMSWRGESGAIAAVKSGHEAIMTPGEYCYFDAYQDAPPTQPEAIGGYLPLAKVYSYNPVPDTLSPEEQKLILGVQANLWTEHVPTPDHAEYMLYPRLLALAEIAWSEPANKSWPRFRNNALEEITYLKSNGYHPFDLKNEVGDRPPSLKQDDHLARGKKVIYHQPYTAQYPAAGDATLTDGWHGGWSYQDHRWQGFSNSFLDVTIDLETETPIHTITATFMQNKGPWVWMPKEVIIRVSNDGETYRELNHLQSNVPEDAEGVLFADFGWEGDTEARYVRYTAYPIDKPGAWLFVDEIVVK